MSTTSETEGEPKDTNRLAQESSPYLLQHAHNPVDWYPWGDEAFEKARAEDKPVFLSIGYSTCHWCHVMERESFESEDIAAVMNEHFVCIKVDREERPDVDAIYMKAVQAMAGRGGWPLSAWLTHDRKPFLGGTYFPPDDRYGRPGFKTVLLRVSELWKTRRDDLLEQADTLVEHVRSRNEAKGGVELDVQTLATCLRQHAGAFDAQRGGFGPAPKFPHSFSISLLLRQATRGEADQILPMVRATLGAMQDGGIHDHVGGGFHRYSTDREWLLPHFEKMLYDQASLAQAYVEAYQVTGEASFADTAHRLFRYVLRDLRDPAGGFHSAEDADSEGEEGKFYVWTPAEVAAVLGEEDAAVFCEVYNAHENGNFVDEATREPAETNILHLRDTIATHAQQRGVDVVRFGMRVGEWREKLLAARSERIRPHLDDKVLTDWNGLMIGALALGGTGLGEPSYVEAAREAADFLLTTMRREDGTLLHRYRDGSAGIDGFLTDYAYLANGLIDLHQATQEPRWLRAARDVARTMVERFRQDDGTFVLSAGRDEELVADTVELYDGDRPSGNSAAIYALLRLGRLTGDADLDRLGRESLAAWSGTIEQYPMGYTYVLRALDMELGPTREIVIAGDPDDPATQALLAAARNRFVARDVILLHPPGQAGDAVREAAPFVAEQLPVDGKPAAYVCTDHSCQAPVTDPEALREALRATD
jgi:uncharacterized protein YyaL (SSP411 family)